ncbi:uncharacterized protein LOC144576321 isoform X2 [Carex rostrata]
MIETRKDMQETVNELNQQRNRVLHLPQLDMMKQFESLWFFGIFSTCLPVLRCVEESSSTKEPELQENLIRGSQNVTLAPPLYPLMSITDDNTSMLPKEMPAFCNKKNVKNCEDDWPDLEEILEETKHATSQVEQLAPESETPKKYIASRPHLYKIERTSPIAFQTVISSSSGATSANLTCMRWTPELHDHFVEAFNQLGGSEKATPSEILNLMKVEGLTIDLVESHLQEFLSQQQKYLASQGSHESSQGSETKGGQIEETPSLRAAISDIGDIDINEALKIQMEVQKQLHEHLEMQRKLQMRIQEQGKHLKRMIEQQQHVTVDESHASSISSLSSNSNDDCTKEKANQTRDNDKHNTMLQI